MRYIVLSAGLELLRQIKFQTYNIQNDQPVKNWRYLQLPLCLHMLDTFKRPLPLPNHKMHSTGEMGVPDLFEEWNPNIFVT